MVLFTDFLSWLGTLISKLWLYMGSVLFRQLLQTVGIANVYPDDKTFVDKVNLQWLSAIIMLMNSLQPTSKSSQAVLADFQNISSSTTYGEIVNFLDNDFVGEGLELEAVPLPSDYNASPPFLNNVTAALPKAFAQLVHGFWTELIRATNASTLCGSSGKCESSLIPLNHTFVIPGTCIDHIMRSPKT
jgi:alpha,alpha-trehalase